MVCANLTGKFVDVASISDACASFLQQFNAITYRISLQSCARKQQVSNVKHGAMQHKIQDHNSLLPPLQYAGMQVISSQCLYF